MLICVSFLLAVFLNHSAVERRGVPHAAVPAKTVSEEQAAAFPAATASPGGGGPECRVLTAGSGEPANSVSIDQGCPAPRP